MVFALALGWLPSSGRVDAGADDVADHLQHLVMPAAVLALRAGGGLVALSARVDDRGDSTSRSSSRRAARGVPARARDPAPRAAERARPLIAIVTVDAALMVSGAVVTESVFAWPGLGSLFTEALARRDYTVLMALLMLASTAVIVFNVAADAHARARSIRA